MRIWVCQLFCVSHHLRESEQFCLYTQALQYTQLAFINCILIIKKMGGPATVDGYVLCCTDNFYECRFIVNQLEYHSSQGYFQASKAKNEVDHNRIRHKQTGMEAWSQGTKVEIRPDWQIVKVRVMYEGNKQKFVQNDELRKALIQTKGKFRFNEGFWGRWNSLILEKIRAELRQDGQEDLKVAKQIQEKMRQYEIEQTKICDKQT